MGYINKFSLINKQPIEKYYKSKLIYDHNDINLTVDGMVLDAQIEIQNIYVLFLTCDCPFEEFLYIHIIDKKLNLLDSYELGYAYGTGILDNIKIKNNKISFSFYGNDEWNIIIYDKPKRIFRLPKLIYTIIEIFLMYKYYRINKRNMICPIFLQYCRIKMIK